MISRARHGLRLVYIIPAENLASRIPDLCTRAVGLTRQLRRQSGANTRSSIDHQSHADTSSPPAFLAQLPEANHNMSYSYIPAVESMNVNQGS